MNNESGIMNQESKAKIKSFTDLNSWREGHKLVLDIYKLTKTFPSYERFGLVNQIKRAAVSITSNLDEGFSRSSYKEKVVFYYISLGSLTETQNQLLIARDLKYIGTDKFNLLANQTVIVNKLINGLIKGAKTMTR